MKTTQNTTATKKQHYTAPKVEKVALDHEISMVMMSNPPGEGMPTQDPLMSLKGFRLFK
ncbi:MAG: hypothetical protein ACKOBN_09525 [Flavobacteriales bacterium]